MCVRRVIHAPIPFLLLGLPALADSPKVLGIVGMYVESSQVSYGTMTTTSPVLLISGNPYAYAGVFLSFATNALATSLIAYKAWCVLVG